MTYVDTKGFPRAALDSGRAYDAINRFFRLLGQKGGAGQIKEHELSVSSHLSLLEGRLRFVQGKISEVSMHLPPGFAAGLNRQFANLMDADAWEDDDELLSPQALSMFIQTLVCTRTNRRPGIGTNGRGSITASWTVDNNRLVLECLPDASVSIVLSRQGQDGKIERAAFSTLKPERVRDVLAPFAPEVWFDG